MPLQLTSAEETTSSPNSWSTSDGGLADRHFIDHWFAVATREDSESAEWLGGSIEAENESTKMLTSRSILYVREVQMFNVSDVAKALRVLLERTVMVER